jgi:hypothetical protein
MTRAEKLEALVKRAITVQRNDYEWRLEAVLDNGNCLKVRDNNNGMIQLMDAYRFLFLHKTARALFGEKRIMVYGGLWVEGMTKPTSIELHGVPAYLHQLQQAVISDNPIDYMYGAVFGNE